MQPLENLLKESINKNISVCITGAGGSIGSELCRQIIYRKPKFLIMIEFSEYNLFRINEESDLLFKACSDFIKKNI